jgi:hypothetical protein
LSDCEKAREKQHYQEQRRADHPGKFHITTHNRLRDCFQRASAYFATGTSVLAGRP